MAFTASITKRDRTRILTSGAAVVQTRFVVNFRHPTTGQRKQIFVKSHKEAIARRDELIAGAVTGNFPVERNNLTVAQAARRRRQRDRCEDARGLCDEAHARR